jgi:hypothetical protein
MAQHPPAPVGTCPNCGKVQFLSRKAALRWARARFPGCTNRAYGCGRFWHLTTVTAGRMEWFRSGRPKPMKTAPVAQEASITS